MFLNVRFWPMQDSDQSVISTYSKYLQGRKLRQFTEFQNVVKIVKINVL